MTAAMKLTPIFLLLAAALPAADTPPPVEFRVSSAFPKYVTADIEFRDATGAKWPNFFYGKPVGDTGLISLDAAKPAAAFTLLCDKMAQDKGDQSRKVLGELSAPEKPPVVTLSVTSLGPLQPAAGKEKDKPEFTADLTGTLEIAGRKTPFKAAATLRHHSGKGDEKNIALMLEARATLFPAALGLKAITTPLEMRLGLTAYPPQPAGNPTKK